jgi:hypothetical protein
MLIILSGLVGQSGVGGQAWAVMQYLAGLRALGHEVVYLEDTGDGTGVYDWEAGGTTHDIDRPAGYVGACMASMGLQDRWIYRSGDEARGMSVEELVSLCARADLLIMRAAPLWHWRPEYALPRRRAFIDVDPGFTQVRLATDRAFAGWVGRCERHFTVGTRIGTAGCPVPAVGVDWIHTLPPVALDLWPAAGGADATHVTTIMRWRGFFDATHDGIEYGQKDREFPRYLDLPRRTSQPFRLAIVGADTESLERHGWEVVPSWTVTRTPDEYRSFVAASRAELGIPKHGYVAARTGWVSDRSVCYLASGRPVLLGDTGFTSTLPVGEGLLVFRDLDGAIECVERMNEDYPAHRRAARGLAEEYFASARVLPRFLEDALS